MRIKSVPVVFLLVLSMISLAQAWNSSPAPATPAGSSPNVTYPTVQPYAPPAQSHDAAYPPPAGYQGQPTAPDPAMSAQGDPAYPYPPYHNPYYDGDISPRNFLSGTIEWVFSLPSTALDSVSNFLDNNFFPRAPATSGGSSQSQPQALYPQQGSPGTPLPLPPANVAAPPSR
jgi:hypothetical protein